MSFISLVVSGGLLSVMADKRDTILDVKMNTTIIGKGLVNKLHKIGKHGFYVIGGNATCAISFIDSSKFLNIFSDDGILKSNNELEQWFNENMLLLDAKSPYFFSIYFGGLSKDNQLCAFTMSSTESRLTIKKAKEGCYSYSLGASPMWEDIILKKRFEMLMQQFNGTKKSVQDIQYEMNKYISTYDPTVSREVDTFYLTRTE